MSALRWAHPGSAGCEAPSEMKDVIADAVWWGLVLAAWLLLAGALLY